MTNVSKNELALRGVSKRHGNVLAIDSVTLDVAPGEFLTLLGPSGSGKTSILMAIAGFVQPDAGDILLGGVRINDTPPEKRNFGVVFQGYALFPHMSVRANVGYPLVVRGVARKELDHRVTRVLDLVQLGALAERLPRQLSGGQQQRVALARALVFEPAIVLLDEPLSALDKKLRVELQSELKALHTGLGTTFIFVTHDQEEAMALSDRIAILREGGVVQAGSPKELYHYPANRFVAEFLGRANFLSGIVAASNATTLSVDLGSANVICAAPAKAPAPHVGAPVTLALRPEHLRFINGEALSPGWNRIAGQVTAVAFTGQQHVYQAQTALGSLTVAIPASGDGDSAPVGAQVALAWPAHVAIPLVE